MKFGSTDVSITVDESLLHPGHEELGGAHLFYISGVSKLMNKYGMCHEVEVLLGILSELYRS